MFAVVETLIAPSVFVAHYRGSAGFPAFSRRLALPLIPPAVATPFGPLRRLAPPPVLTARVDGFSSPSVELRVGLCSKFWSLVCVVHWNELNAMVIVHYGGCTDLPQLSALLDCRNSAAGCRILLAFSLGSLSYLMEDLKYGDERVLWCMDGVQQRWGKRFGCALQAVAGCTASRQPSAQAVSAGGCYTASFGKADLFTESRRGPAMVHSFLPKAGPWPWA
ncbi:hypothetical protein SASPL_147134 [Salvia splendens]|uniref:Uncharacterized protein n=1 Tax=Salvia splendens TaxID=180675 RepID=A0A8X8Z5V8_SALSN|nr:hypothetical protein SASPL_147134 [Salvia splendens]